MSVTEVIRILILIGSVVLLSACGGGGGSGDPSSDPGTDVVIEPVDAGDDTGSDETPVDQEPDSGSGDSSQNDDGLPSDQTPVNGAVHQPPVLVSLWSDSTPFGEGRIIDDTISFSGTAEPYQVVELWVNGTLAGSTAADMRGDWFFDYTSVSLAPGDYSAMPLAVDRDGSETRAVQEFNFRYDPNAPAAPLIETISDDSYQAGDGYTSDGSVIISGSAEYSLAVRVFLDGALIGTVIADENNQWVLDHSSVDLADGTYQITAESEVMGLVSAISAQFTLVVDRVDPSAPAFVSVSQDTGLSSSDGITSDNGLVINGTSEPYASVRVRLDGSVVGSVEANSSGNWGFDYSGALLNDGSHSIEFQSTDRAGNVSNWSTGTSIIIDTTAPSTATNIVFSPDSGTAGDGITDTGALSFSGNAEADSVVRVMANATLIGSANTGSDGSWSLDLTSTPLANGIYSITTVVSDVAGNESSASSAFDLIVDATPPTAPTIVDFSTDTGIVGDFITSDSTPAFSGTAQPDVEVEVFFDGSTVGSVVADALGNWNYSHPVSLADGVYSVTTLARSLSGNQSPISNTLTITVDATAPLTPLLSMVTDDTHVGGDFITSDNQLIFSGGGEANSLLQLSLNGSSIGSTTVDASGNWLFDYSSTSLSDGDFSLGLTSEDAAGNSSIVTATVISIDTLAPSPPLGLAFSNDSGVVGDGITSDNGLLFSGTAEPNTQVDIFVDGVVAGISVVDGLGAWSFDYSSTALADGAHSITASATDTAGNSSGFSAALALTIDTVAPVMATVDSVAPDSNTPGDGITNSGNLVFAGTAEANLSVTVLLDAVSIGNATSDGSGNWSFDHSASSLADGIHSIVVYSEDAAGNSSTSAAFILTVDTVAPLAPVVAGVNNDTGTVGDGITGDNQIEIFGTAEAGSQLTVQLDGGPIGTTVAANDGSWNFDYTATTLADGSYNLTAQALDDAGNMSVASANYSITINSATPNAPVIMGITDDTATATDGITSDNRLLVMGSADANTDISVFVDGVAVGNTSADGSGAWAFDYTGTTLADGSYILTAQAQNAVGNVSAVSANYAISVDTLAPNSPTALAVSNDTGVAGDGVTSDTTLVLSGTSEAGSQVDVLLDGISVGSTVADAGGNWSLDHTASVLANGAYILTAQATDGAGNLSTASGPFNITVDSTPPSAPNISSINDDTDVSADGITSDNTLVINGSAEANSTVELFLGGVSVGTTTADGFGNWSYDNTGTVLADGSYTLTARASDLAANLSPLSTGFSISIDSGAPAAPVVLSISDDTATAGDGVTSDNTLVVTGSAEANSSVEVFLDAISIGSTTADGTGNWSYDHTGTTLAEGSYSVTAQATDTAGNLSPISSGLGIRVDRSAPIAPSVTAINDDTATAADGITNDNTLVIVGTSEADNNVQVFLDGVGIGTVTADGSGNWSYDYTATTLADGGYTVTAQAADLAGNVSPLSANFVITIDSGIPSAPIISGITDDTASAADGITSDNTLVINGTAEVSSAIEIFMDAASIGTTTTDGGGSWSFDYTATAIADGSYTLTARATDAAGNVSASSVGFGITVDRVAPSAPVVTGITDDTAAASDGVTSDSTLIIFGTSEANATVEVFESSVSLGSTTADGSGNWSYDHRGTTLTDGSYTFTAQAADVAGNLSTLSSSFGVTVDTTFPAAPTVTAISDDTATAGDGITSDNTLFISGTAEANASVQVFIDGSSIGTTSADGVGNWSYNHTATPIVDGSYTLTAQATDSAGNNSAVSSGFSITIDSNVPSAPAITAISDDTATGADGITNDNTLVISGTSEADASVEVFVDAASIGSTTADGSGNWSFDHTATTLADGSYALTAQATDSSGNLSALSASFDIVIDTVAPSVATYDAITDDTGIVGDFVTSDNTLIASGSAEANATVELYYDGGLVGSHTADGSGNWVADYSGSTSPDGVYTVYARVIDSAGNASANSSNYFVTVDTAIPAAPVVTAISDDTGTPADGVTSDTSLFISGTAEANASVEVFIDSVSLGTTTADGSGNWSYDHTGTTLANGSFTITAQASDLAANVSVLSSGFALTVDDNAPAAPAVTAVTDDTGTAADGITNDNTLVISGTAEANNSVEVFLDASSIGTATADGSGNWSYDYTGTVLADGSHTFSAQATDAAGNLSVVSSDFTVTIDTSVPTAPVVTAISDDTGTAGDGITSDNTLVISGTATANITVETFLDGVSIGTTSADGSGNWSFDYTATTLLDASYVLTATTINNAGTSSVSSADFNLTVITNGPAISTMSPADNNTAVGFNDNLVFTFDAVVNAGTGNIVIYHSSDDTVFETIPVGDARISGSGTNTITLNPSGTFVGGTGYYVNIASTAWVDQVGNTFAGISDNSTWNFTTNATSIVSTTPADEATGVLLDATFTLNFNETVNVNSGAIRICNLADTACSAPVDTIDVTSGQVTGGGTSTLVVTQTDVLTPNTAYFFQIDNDALRNDNGVAFAGITDSTTLNFTTVNVSTPSVTDVTSSTADGTYGSGDTIVIQVVFDENVDVTGTPQIELELDSSNKLINYSNGSGGTTLTFNYDVTVGDSKTDLAYASTSALTLNGGTIRSANNANANLTLATPGAANSLSANKNINVSSPYLDITSLTPADGFFIQGRSSGTGENFARTVSSGGDINGDGFEDLVVSAEQSGVGAASAGAAWVVYGAAGSTRSSFNIDSMDSSQGFYISGKTTADYLGTSTNLAGDINGDGYSDLIVSASANDDGASEAGTVYVVWGQAADRANFSASTITSASANGFRILGYEGTKYFPTTYTTAVEPWNNQSTDARGDFNGDGIDDLLLGHHQSAANGFDAGMVYLILGSTGATRSDITLSTSLSSTSQGFRVHAGATTNARMGFSIQFAGDFNGDGYNDLVIGAPYNDTGASDSGRVYVVFGKPGSSFSDIDVTTISNTEGFAIGFTQTNAWLGGSVAASDVNGDGLSDLIIGSVRHNANSRGDSGSVMVLYGHTAATYSDLTYGAALGTSGYYIEGESAGDYLAYAAEGVGDVDGDGVGDLLLSTDKNDSGGFDAGAAWLIYGASGTSRSDIDLATLDSSDGFKIIGDSDYDNFGRVNSAGDLNGDGYQDMLITSINGDNNGVNIGEINVLWGKDFRALVTAGLTGTAGADRLVGTSGADVIVAAGGADRVSAGAGDDDIQVADLSFGFIDGGRGSDTLSLAGSGLDLDLRSLNYEVINGVEIIDLGDNGNSLTLDSLSLLMLSDEVRTLYVKGGSSDYVVTDGSETWVANGTSVVNTVTYNRYDLDEISLYIQDSLSQPTTPSAPSVDSISVDTATVGDEITSDTGLVFSGTSGAYYDVEVFVDGVSVGTATANAAGAWSYDHSATGLADATYTITAVATNLGGYVSAASSGLDVVVDTIAPSVPTISSITNDTGNVADGITSDDTLEFTGGADPYASVELFIDGGSIGSVSAGAGGIWNFDYTGTSLADGSYVVTAISSDVAGNASSPSSNFNLTVDTGTPSTPTVASISDDTGTGGDGITSDATLIITGTAEANSSVNVLLNSAAIGSVSADGAGNWSLDYTGTSLSDGSYSITATASDTAANASAESSALNITVDGSSPLVNTLSPANSATDVSVDSNLVVTFNETVYETSGNIELRLISDDSLVEAFDITGARVSGSGTSTITIDPTASLYGGTQYYVEIDAGSYSDLAGNSYAGISGNAIWTFTTGDTAIVSTVPADEDTGVALNTTITLNFSEAMTVNSGDLRIRQLSDNAIVDTIDITSGQVSGNGTSSIVIQQSDVLDSNTSYYIELDSGALRNGAGVDFAGISGNSTLNFTTATVTPATVTNVTSATPNGTYRAGATIEIQVAFDAVVNVTGMPQLLVDLNGTDRYANYVSGTGSTTITLEYVVASGDETSDLGYVSTNSLTLNGGTIRNNLYANSNLTLAAPGASNSLRNNKAIAITSADLDVTNLTTNDGFFIEGAESSTVYFGHSISSGGDFNGDGFDDLVIGVPDSNLSNTSGGYAYLVYGKSGDSRSDISMSSFSSSDGFYVTGSATGDKMGSMVDISGDLNGDGYDDFVVLSARQSSGASDAGSLYIIWGNASPGNVNLASDFSMSIGATNSDGFVILGSESNDEIGYYNTTDPQNAQFIDASGDFNGDGIDDLIIGHNQSDAFGLNAGAAYLIFGEAGSTRANFRLDSYASEGFLFYNGNDAGNYVGHSVQYIGDFNGDGKNDVIIGAPGVSSDDGEAYVVFGHAGPGFSNIDLDALNGTNGFTIRTSTTNAQLGGSVSSSDINGDGLTDIIIGVPEANTDGYSTNGAAIIIYGSSSGSYSDVSLASVGSAGYVINGENSTDRSGHSVRGMGDINGDGIDDIMLSTIHDDDGGTSAGAAWVIFGESGTSRSDINLDTLDSSDGFKVVGDASGDEFGRSATAGDINGDGYQDFMLSSVAGDNAGSYNGEVNVFWGKPFTAGIDVGTTGDSGVNHLVGTSGDDTLNGAGGADTIYAGAGDDTIQVADISFARIHGGRGLDTLSLTGSTLSLDLRSVDYEVIKGIEIIDLGDNGNGLTLDSTSLLMLSEQVRTLYVQGGTSDYVITDGAETWTANGTSVVNSVTYNRYDLNEISLYIEQTLSQPATPSAPAVTGFSEDTGTVGDGITSDSGLIFSGTSGGYFTVNVYIDGGFIGYTVADAVGNWSYDHSATSLADATYSITAQATNLSGYVSAVSAVMTVTVDSAAMAMSMPMSMSMSVSEESGSSETTSGAINLSSLSSEQGFLVEADSAGGHFGVAINTVGDVNGDGFEDFVVGAPNENSTSGAAYVIYGAAGATRSDMVTSAITNGTHGFRIYSSDSLYYLGAAVGGAGDFNDDGYDDVFVASTRVDNAGGNEGALYVIFGKPSGSDIDVASLASTDGFKVYTEEPYAHIGESTGTGGAYDDQNGQTIDAGGDFNGDGIDDLIVGIPQSDLPSGTDSGKAVVLFGQSAVTISDINIDTLGSNDTIGMVINGTTGDYWELGQSSRFVGDYNADGYDDIAVSAWQSDAVTALGGQTFIIFGQPGPTYNTVDVTSLSGVDGFAVSSTGVEGSLGHSVDGGDFNGDGISDLIISHHRYSNEIGGVHVIYGNQSGSYSNLTVDTLGVNEGYFISGVAQNDRLASALSNGGDFNADGIDDILIGAYRNDDGGENSGAAWLILGQDGVSRGNIDLSSLDPSEGFQIVGDQIEDFTGQAVGAADINGDGFSDLIVGSPWGDNLAEQGGEVAVIWGKAYYSDNNTSFSGTAAAENLVGTSGDDVLVSGGGADAIFSGSGDDVIQIVDTDFYKINGGLGADTLAIMPGAVSLDLSALAPLTVGGIEVIDLGDNGSSLMLSERALLAMSIEGRSLYVDGGSSDGVSLAATDSWVSAGVETVGGVDYVRYESGGAVLYVESGIVVSIM